MKDLNSRRPHHLGFSLVELLVVVAIVVILFSIFIPYVGKMRELDHRASCANNLRAIHVAFTAYAKDHNDRVYPRTAFDRGGPARYVAFTGASAVPVAAEGPMSVGTAAGPSPTTGPATAPAPGDAPSGGITLPVPIVPSSQPAASQPAVATRPATVVSVSPDGVQLNDVTASLWLLTKYVSPDVFVCPSSDASPDPMFTNGQRVDASRRSNFTSGKHLSYSYAYPFRDVGGRAFLNSDHLDADFPVLADKNPGVSPDGKSNVVGPEHDADPVALAVANSRNHDRAGQNVLLPTGEVRFQKVAYCGYTRESDEKTVRRDNLYTAYSATPLPDGDVPGDVYAKGVFSPNVGPAHQHDAFLVPAE